jgi:hypothetical protein
MISFGRSRVGRKTNALLNAPSFSRMNLFRLSLKFLVDAWSTLESSRKPGPNIQDAFRMHSVLRAARSKWVDFLPSTLYLYCAA